VTLRFHLGRIPVEVHASFLLVTMALGAGRGGEAQWLAEWLAVVFVSVLVHELGPAAVAQASGQTARIALHGMGGTTYSTGEISKMRRVAVCLAGPTAGFLFGGAILAVAQIVAIPEPWLHDLLWVNLGWGVMNLLPILPLDGAQALQALFSRGVRELSILTGLGLLCCAVWLGWRAPAFLLGWLLLRALLDEWNARRRHKLDTLYGEADALVKVAPAGAVQVARRGLRLAETAEDRLGFAMVLASSGYRVRDEDAMNEALVVLQGSGGPPPVIGELLNIVKRYEEALPYLREAYASDPGASRAMSLLTALFYTRRYDEAAELARKSFEAYGLNWFAYNAACCEARRGDVDAAFAWLQRAIAAGWNKMDELDSDEDLAAVREHPGYPEFRASLVKAS
jgi:Zn-dependent protease